MPGRTFTGASGYRYGFNGMEKDDEAKGSGNSYDFGARLYDPRIGRWMSIDPLFAKYPSLSPYTYAANSPLWVVDKDGEDIIILSAPDAVNGLGHAAILIGNDKEGWTLYSKNGTHGSIPGAASSGRSDKDPQNGVYVGSLDNFAQKYNLTEKGEVEYKAAFKITTDKETDEKMKEAASKQVNQWYDVTGTCSGSCIDVPKSALAAGGLDAGTDISKELPSYPGRGQILGANLGTAIPNVVYGRIVKNNEGTVVTESITPSAEAIKAKQDSYAQSVSVTEFIKVMESIKQGQAEKSKAKQGTDGRELAPADNTKVSKPTF